MSGSGAHVVEEAFPGRALPAGSPRNDFDCGRSHPSLELYCPARPGPGWDRRHLSASGHGCSPRCCARPPRVLCLRCRAGPTSPLWRRRDRRIGIHSGLPGVRASRGGLRPMQCCLAAQRSLAHRGGGSHSRCPRTLEERCPEQCQQRSAGSRSTESA